jgi:glycosyltransferase involved in cell wall biosynthesis
MAAEVISFSNYTACGELQSERRTLERQMAIHVLHILGSAQPESTGMARIVRALALGLDPDYCHVHALFLAGAGPLVDSLQQAGATASALDWKQGSRDPLGALRLWRFLRRRHFDLVHLHYGGRSVSLIARAATNAKIIRHLHGRIQESRGLVPVSFSVRGYDAVVAVSKAVASRVVDGTARVIYAGIEIPPATPLRHRSDSEIVIGTAGRLVDVKGIEYLIGATSALRNAFPNVLVEIAGSGPCREKLEKAVKLAGLQQNVKFLGWVDEIGTSLPRWDIFVMPSLEEGFPIAALDAMAAGLPIVATSVGGIPELVEDGTTGWLVPPRDVESLASRIRLLIDGHELRLSMGTAGYRRVRDHFSNEQMVTNFAQLYEELLHRDSA